MIRLILFDSETENPVISEHNTVEEAHKKGRSLETTECAHYVLQYETGAWELWAYNFDKDVNGELLGTPEGEELWEQQVHHQWRV